MLCTNTFPKSSFLTLPQKQESPPKSEIAASVLATDPPESFLIKFISFNSLSESSCSTKAMVPFLRLFFVRSSSLASAKISRTAFPMPRILLLINFFLFKKLAKFTYPAFTA